MTISSIAALVISLAACATDLRSRRIPNLLTLGAALAAFTFHLASNGTLGFTQSLLGWLLGAGVFFLPFALGGLGGGDIKLLAALGAWLGPMPVLWLSMYTGVAGAVMAVVVSMRHGYLGQALRNIRLLLMHWRIRGLGPVDEITLAGSPGLKLAYALPIFAGTALTIWLQ